MPHDQTTQELTDRFDTFLRRYYREDIGELATHYPHEQKSLFVEYGDLHQFDPNLAEDWQNSPDQIQEYANEALRLYDLPADLELADATVRLVGFPDDMSLAPDDLTKDHGGKYVAIKGDLARVTTKDEFPSEIAFECERCGTMSYVPQVANSSRQDPYECAGCERKGPFRVNEGQTEWNDYCRVRVKTPPDQNDGNDSSHIDGYVVGDLVHYGHKHGLLARAGEKATVYGVVERRELSNNDLLFERVLRVEGVEFVEDENNVNVEEHLPAIRDLASRDDAVDKFAESLVPELYATDAWEAALELGVAYLFAAPRIDVPGGPTYRGDIHALLVSDYGMGKSSFNRGIERYSPKCIHKSATALSSEVGLLAAATEDDFGAGQWTIKPGILVRANGGHVILDEIDKPDVDMTKMNDALEGSQRVDVEKAGQSATYNSRVGLLAAGNPVDGRFDRYEPIAEQLGLKQSFLSRFDGIITMDDEADKETDKQIADTIGKAYIEAQEAVQDGREDFDQLDHPVPVDVGRAWVAYARENIHPRLKKRHVESIKGWYGDEVRQLNVQFSQEGSDGADMPVPASARVVEATIRFSVAFARVHLRDEVIDSDVERAKNLSKRLVAQNWDGERFDANRHFQPSARGSDDSREAILSVVTSDDWMFPSQIADETRMNEDTVREWCTRLASESNPPALEVRGGKYRRA